MREDFRIKILITFFSPEKKTKIIKKNENKNRKSGFEVLLGIRCRFQNCHCFCSCIDGF